VKELIKLYNDVFDQEFYSLPEQFEEATLENGVRYELDTKLLQILSKKSLDMKPLYEYFAREPIIKVKPLS